LHNPERSARGRRGEYPDHRRPKACRCRCRRP